jgi:hypothetical protein
MFKIPIHYVQKKMSKTYAHIYTMHMMNNCNNGLHAIVHLYVLVSCMLRHSKFNIVFLHIVIESEIFC